MSETSHCLPCIYCRYNPNCKYIPMIENLEKDIEGKIDSALDKNIRTAGLPFSVSHDIYCSERKELPR